MKILCVSDHVDPLVYSPAIRERFRDVNLVISAGDLPMEYLGFLASSLNRPVGFVFGNHNLRELDRFRGKTSAIRDPDEAFTGQFRNFFGATMLEDRVLCMEGMLIAGLGGSIRYNDGRHQFTDREMMWRIVRLIPRLLWNRVRFGRYVDILVTHAAPAGINDREDPCHVGFRSFRWFMRQFRPRYLIHGHIHLYDLNAPRVARYESTDVINVYDHYVLEIEAEEPSGA